MIILIFSSSLANLSLFSDKTSSESIFRASVGQVNTQRGFSSSRHRLHFLATPVSSICMAPMGQVSRHRPQPTQTSSLIMMAPSTSSIASSGQMFRQGALSGEQCRQKMGTPFTTRIAFWGQIRSHLEHSSHSSGIEISSFKFNPPGLRLFWLGCWRLRRLQTPNVFSFYPVQSVFGCAVFVFLVSAYQCPPGIWLF